MQKAKTRKRVLGFVVLLIIATILYSVGFIAVIHITGATDSAEAADVIIVMGAGLRGNGRPGWALTRRSERAAGLWHDGLAPLIMCTGAKAEGFPRSEADACREILLGRGVSASAILMEEMSRSTEESAAYAGNVLDGLGLSRAVLVSDSYHMLRASWIYRQQDLTVFGSPVPASRINNPLFYLYSLLREFIAFHWFLLKQAFNLPFTHVPGL